MINSMNDLPTVASYLQRIGAEPRSLRVAVVKEVQGPYWQDIATIRVCKDGTIDAPEEYAPTEKEAAKIKDEVLAAEWPQSMKLGKSYTLPEELKKADPEDIFELKDASGHLVMIQQRVTLPESGDKRYVPWTFWTDHQWRKAEPEGALPLWGIDKVGDHTTVFIHEGAKAARAVHRLVNPRTQAEKDALLSHPWGQELSGAAHVGWIGGALSPFRTDWSSLAKAGITRAYIVADNDKPGKAAIPNISQRLRGMTVFSVEFTENWPISFDLADKFPPSMFSTIGSHKYYTGPAFKTTLHPATWATDIIPNPAGKGKPIAALRKEFIDMWIWIEETDTFMCREMPEINQSLGQFNSIVGPFSHVAATGQLLHKTYKGRTAKICYRPDIAARIVTDRTTSAINLHSPTLIKPSTGDEGPWLEFLDYLFPIDKERKEVMRWCATLVARPDIRMMYGMLLVSERQGMGKSTLGERILAPLVGLNNTGFPGERDIVESGFNGWVANKRLIVVGEIYTGQSFKAYNMLKSYLTDKNINVNEKFQRPYTIENWVHVLACSNSKKALRIEETDRRWFYPKLNEQPWDRSKWGEFYEWLHSGGLSIILNWAQNHGDYVLNGEHAPMTQAKKAMIEDSKGEVLNMWADLLDAAVEEDEAVAFAISEVRDTMRKKHGKIYESQLEFKKEALRRGWHVLPERIGIDGVLSWVVLSPKLRSMVDGLWGNLEEDKTALKEVRSKAKESLQRINDRMNGGF